VLADAPDGRSALPVRRAVPMIDDEAGTVPVRLLEQVSARACRALEAEAAVTAWLHGVRIGTGYLSPTMKAHSA
jgi:aminoglycoside phosphotransferase